jgi:ATPase subunit of ABC transporter with duplicated ATPase domains
VTASIVVSDLSFAWPGGFAVFSSLDLVIRTGRTGLVGANGSGKSTLLRLLTGELTPARGSVSVAGAPGYLPQDITLQADLKVEDVAGIAAVRAAVAAVEAGDTSAEHFSVIGDDWDAEARARALLDRLGLGHVTLDRRVGGLSGGESVLLALAAVMIQRPGVLLLDEPTNNLDQRARQLVYDAVEAWRGVMVIVSHDRELLERMDTTVELYQGRARSFGGTISDYEAAIATEQEAARRAVTAAGSDLRRQRRDLAEARIRLDRRRRYGDKMWENKREPKVVMGQRKRQAEVAAGKHRNLHIDRVKQAEQRLGAAERAVRDDDQIRVDLPATAVHSRQAVLALDAVQLRCGPVVTLFLRGPERVALTGPNGSGKTTLLQTVSGDLPPRSGQVRLAVPARLLPQRMDLLDGARTVADNVARFAPHASPNAIRANLARLLFPGSRADQTAATLSGGELFRATLAALLLAEPAPQLLMLDEPTNNLDMASMRRLTEALRCYRGALLVASHDMPFLRALGLTRWLRLEAELHETDPR